MTNLADVNSFKGLPIPLQVLRRLYLADLQNDFQTNNSRNSFALGMVYNAIRGADPLKGFTVATTHRGYTKNIRKLYQASRMVKTLEWFADNQVQAALAKGMDPKVLDGFSLIQTLPNQDKVELYQAMQGALSQLKKKVLTRPFIPD